MATPREHIEQLRKTRFSIGGEENPLASMLDQAVKYLSAELYTKDVHFLMELIQNAEDNEYLEGVDPSLEFVITSHDLTATGAPATLLIFNNERGFSAKNIDSICNVGNSSKKGNRKRGYIGEKGIGFKSVFLITAQPYIFSNGYQIRFNERPCPHCRLGYIVPEWVEENPSLSDIKQVYGSGSTLPTTTIVLPLKPDKVKPVKQQLSSIHPEVILFLSKIKHLSVREDNEDPSRNTISAIAITKETNLMRRKNIDAESYTLHLSTEENSNERERECSYYMWKQRFPVRQENKVERRMEVEEWVITLAFPNADRLDRGISSPGVYAFLPTEMVTNFPFIIQADFILSSSRETILLDNVWNQGILDCVPLAFANALISLVKGTEDAPASSLPRMFQFLPVNSSSYPKLNTVRESIKAKLAEESIVPSESYTEQKFFHKPCEVGRLMPEFWNILKKARRQGVSLHTLSTHGCYVLNSSFDKPEYDQILNFLGVNPVTNEWYAKCVKGSNLATGILEATYVELLLFLADNWQSRFCSTSMGSIPLIKYVGHYGSEYLRSVNESAWSTSRTAICLSCHPCHVSWLIDWNREFRCVANQFFMPRSTQEAIGLCSRKEVLLKWLANQVKVATLNVNEYARRINDHLNSDRNLVIAYVHFLCHSVSQGYLSEQEVNSLCKIMPLVDNYGQVTTIRNGVLVPANGSKWAELIVSNPWRNEGYIELGEDYSRPACFAGQIMTGKQLMEFVKTHLGAGDISYISPPNAVIPTVSGPLTKENAFLLLDWIQSLRYRRIRIPEKFLTCIRKGSWLRTTMNGSHGYSPPSQSFLLNYNRESSNWGNILQNGYVLADIPLIDQSFYGDKINEYKEELKTIGVRSEYEEACEFIGNHLMSLAASFALTKSQLFSILNFIRFLNQNFRSPDKFIQSIRERRWLRTSHGDRSPVESVLGDAEWATAKQISDIPFIDEIYYGQEILCFRKELQLLGVKVGFSGNFELVVDHLNPSSRLSWLTAEALLLILNCMRHSISSDKLVKALQHAKCFKTSIGYKSPGECFLSNPEWGCLLEVFSSFPLIGHDNYYGSGITSFKKELKQLGVKVDYQDTVTAFVLTFRQQASFFSITKENVFSLLSCYRQLKETPYQFPSDLQKCICEEKWLRTRLGDYRVPGNCILFSPEWKSICPITLLPFIDDSDNSYGKNIHEYRKELKSLGVILKLKAGAEFVASSLFFPQNPNCITPENVLSLLECIRILLQKKDYSFPEAFLKKASREWLKTYVGYRAPDKCCLFDPNWGARVKLTEGPFIDGEFYGSSIISYRKELGAIGVAVDAEKACSLLASHLDLLSEFGTIVRIYDFLNQYNWKPKSEATSKIWIPDGNQNGKWAKPGDCVRHDSDSLFSLQLNVLDRHYKLRLLDFFCRAFDVKFYPSLDDYCKLWKAWEISRHQLTQDECCAFWRCFVKLSISKTETALTDDLVKLPVVSGSGEILLAHKHDAFIADDLLLEDLFQKSSPHPIFVWHPRPSLPSLPWTKLLEVYRRIGVRTISESVQKEDLPVADGVELRQVNPKDVLIGKGLIRIILGFLANPSFNMEAEKRHEAVQCLLNLTVVETLEPITVNYSLSLSSGEVVNARSSRMIRWDRGGSKLFSQKMDKSSEQKNIIEYATYFSEAIAGGVLWEKEDHISALPELIKLAFLLDFDDEAVQFLMKSKNLQIFMEDEEFLSAAFPSDKV